MLPFYTYAQDPYEEYNDPQRRRLAMLNRARRDEMDAIIYGAHPHHGVVRTGDTPRTQESALHRMIGGLRAAIGNSLIAAGNRIHSAA